KSFIVLGSVVLRDQQSQVLPHYLAGLVAESPFRRRIEKGYPLVFVSHYDRVQGGFRELPVTALRLDHGLLSAAVLGNVPKNPLSADHLSMRVVDRCLDHLKIPPGAVRGRLLVDFLKWLAAAKNPQVFRPIALSQVQRHQVMDSTAN